MKNESKVLSRMLNTVWPILDYYVVVDTGSEDDSKKIVKDFFDLKNIPGEIYDHPWVNFSDARNFALNKAKNKSDFIFWIDCDEQLILSDSFDVLKFKNKLSHYDKANAIISYGTSNYARCCFIRSDKSWVWKGVVHEYIYCNSILRHLDINDEIKILVTPDGNSWQDTKSKYIQHARMLEEEIKKTNDPRDIFYLAQSYKDAGQPENAIKWYRKRAERTDGYYEERYYSQFMIGILSKSKPIEQCIIENLKCNELDSLRAEHLLNTIIELQNAGMWNSSYIFSKYAFEKYHNKNPYPTRQLFIDTDTYAWKLLNIHQINCEKTGNKFPSIIIPPSENTDSSLTVVKDDYEKITIGFIAHNSEANEKYIKPSILNLKQKGGIEVLVVSDKEMPAKNYNYLIDNCKTKYLLLIHEDVTFGIDFMDNLKKTINHYPDFAVIGAVGTDKDGIYHWSESDKIKEVERLDCCCILINKQHGIRFDSEIFDEYHLYVEDYCMQAIRNYDLKCYTILTNASEANAEDQYENKENYFKHHSVTVNQRGYCWGRYYEFLQKLENKWNPILTIVDVCIISYAKTKELEEITIRGIKSLLESERTIQFYIYIIESNKSVCYDNISPYIKTLYTDESFGYNKYLNIAVSLGYSDYVVLCNNDLIFEKGWATEIIRQMNKYPYILSASPFCPQTNPTELKKYPVITGTIVRQQLAGWCIFQHRKIYDVIGKLNEDVDFWFSDNIYADQLIKHKITHALITNSVVNHHEHNLGVTGKNILDDNKKIEYTTGQYQKYLNAKNSLI